MALVTNMMKVRKASPKVHGSTECEWSTFELEGQRYVQLDTYGSKTRQERGKMSQSIQLNVHALKQLRTILDEVLAEGE